MKRFPETTTILAVALALSGTVNIILGVRTMWHARGGPLIPPLAAGTTLPELTGRDPQGRPGAIRFDETSLSTVLLVLQPGCGWCNKNMPNWKELIARQGSNYRFCVVSLEDEGLGSYLASSGLAVPALTELPTGGIPDRIRAGGTPQTVVVGRDGTIIKVWRGAFTRDEKADVEQFFNVRLPVDVAPLAQ